MNKLPTLVAILFLSLLSACVVVGGQQKGTGAEISQANVALATEYYRLGRMALALENLKVALAADPSSVEANSLIALVYNQIDETSLAQAHFEKATKLVTRDTTLYGQVHNNYGTFLCSNNQSDLAEKHFILAAKNKLYQTPKLAYENAGLCALNKPDLVKARKYFTAALAIDSKMPRVIFAIAKLNFDEKKYQQALAFLMQLHQANEVTPQTLLLASKSELALGNKNRARALLDELASQFPDSNEAKNRNSGWKGSL